MPHRPPWVRAYPMGRPVRYRRTTSRAWLAASSWMRSRRRRPESVRRQKVPSGVARPMYTSPTGLSRSSRSGPATPVTDTAMSAPVICRAPSAMARAVSSDTAPYWSSVSWGTPSTAALTEVQ